MNIVLSLRSCVLSLRSVFAIRSDTGEMGQRPARKHFVIRPLLTLITRGSPGIAQWFSGACGTCVTRAGSLVMIQRLESTRPSRNVV